MAKTRKKWKIAVLCVLAAVLCVGIYFGIQFATNPYIFYASANNTSNFQSKETTQFHNINGKTVTVDTFVRHSGEKLNNPNVGQAIMLWQCIKYKQQHPDVEVTATLTSFHLSVVASVCLNPNSKLYGYMKSLYDKEYDNEGFVRISYLLVEAAKNGVNVIVVGQIDANPVAQAFGVKKNDHHFDEYFEGHMNDDCHIEGKKVKDFMTFRKAEWTSYGDKSATDMMHNKTCTVSHYIDKFGVEHGGTTWLSSTNLDGINVLGANGNDSLQTGVIISDHEEIRQAAVNYTTLMTNYCGQEQVSEFRSLIRNLNSKQISMLENGQTIEKDQQIVYLGSETDKVFEIYFTPIGGSSGTWDTSCNPYCKYIAKLLPASNGNNAITLAWNNVKYLSNFELANTMAQMINTAFLQQPNLDNRLYLRLPGINKDVFSQLKEGQNIGMKKINKNLSTGVHSKDLQMSYVEDGVRYFTTIFNSLNIHQGSMSYQTNTILVVKETEQTGNNVYVSLGKSTTLGTISEAERIAV